MPKKKKKKLPKKFQGTLVSDGRTDAQARIYRTFLVKAGVSKKNNKKKKISRKTFPKNIQLQKNTPYFGTKLTKYYRPESKNY